jgi:hypothetical protein
LLESRDGLTQPGIVIDDDPLAKNATRTFAARAGKRMDGAALL